MDVDVLYINYSVTINSRCICDVFKFLDFISFVLHYDGSIGS